MRVESCTQTVYQPTFKKTVDTTGFKGNTDDRRDTIDIFLPNTSIEGIAVQYVNRRDEVNDDSK